MKKYTLFIIGVLTLSLTSCHFLDKNPDERAEINTRQKVRLLLVNGYDFANIASIGEMMSDNTVDNDTPDSRGHVNNKVPFNQTYNQLFAWEDVTAEISQDTPYNLWEHCYKNIAVANQALSAIADLEAANPNDDFTAEKAEALLIRAYNHFILVNIFCQAYKDSVASLNDLGIHYMTAAETAVKPDYDRGSVQSTYSHIRQDLEQALQWVSDSYYTVPKYHFNVQAAHAFAAKFYLFTREYEKVIEHANRVLGTSATDARKMMFNAASAKALGNGEEERNAWVDVADNSNLMIVNTMSYFLYTFVPSYCRYTFNRIPKDAVLTGSGPCWDDRFPGCNIWQYNQNFGGFLAKIDIAFEYTDKIAGIGYAHIIRRELTAGEVLLARAEAEIMLGQTAAAVEDMNVYCKSWLCTKDLTDARINSYYRVANEKAVVSPQSMASQICPTLHNYDMSSSWTISEEQKPYIWCVLALRRFEKLHDGERIFDIKRYGIEIQHEIGYPIVTKTLVWNDDRRALQLPQEAILAGQKANPRVILGDQETVNAAEAPATKNDLELYVELKGETPQLVPFDVQ